MKRVRNASQFHGVLCANVAHVNYCDDEDDFIVPVIVKLSVRWLCVTEQ